MPRGVPRMESHPREVSKRVVLTSGPDLIEREMAEAIAQGFDVQVLAGEISLKESRKILHPPKGFD